VVSSTGLLDTWSQSQCKLPTQLENARTGIREVDTGHFPYPDAYLSEPVLSLDLGSIFSESTEILGYFLAFSDKVEVTLTFKMLKIMTLQQMLVTKKRVLFKSVV